MRVRALGVVGLAFVFGAIFPGTSVGQIGVQQLRERGEQLAVMAAVEAGMQTEKQFRAVHDFVTAAASEEKWRAIPWEPDLWNGRVKAAEQGKPLFIWAMNGDPLGCV